jgi:HD-GYP domain-containing protein (c-di-GMP phosphodiesterase class II)
MRFGPGRLVVLCGLLPTIAAALLSLARLPFFTNWEYGVYDRILRATPAVRPAGRVVIVDIDDRSLTSIGQWPWRRDLIGQLIATLRDLGAATVALDIIFAEPDRFEVTGAPTDAALAQTLREGRVVLGYAFTFDGDPGAASPCTLNPLGLAIFRRDDSADTPFFRATGAVCNLPVLTRDVQTSGFLNAAPDPDGVLRRAPLLLELDGRVYPGLALAAVNAVRDTRSVALRVENVNTSSLLLDDRTVPLDGRSNLMLRYRGPKRTFPYVSAVDVIERRSRADAFKDKIVLVGTTALGTREVVSTPLDTLFAGVEVQATIADNLLQQDFMRRPEHGVALETQIVLILGILAALLVRRFGITLGATVMLACLAGAWFGSVRLLSGNGMFVSPLYPTMGLVTALVAMSIARLASEHRRADRAGEETVTSRRLMVQSLLSLTEVRDAETGRHSRRIQEYTRLLAEELASHPRFREYLTPDRIELISSLAPLHDIGKVGVPDNLLRKPGELTPEELAEMRKHPGYGRDVILHAQEEVGVHDDVILNVAKDIAYTHHEKWNGSGYPQGLQGTAIPVAGRVIAVVDVYDASTTRALYRTPISHDEAVALIVKGRGVHFDPDVVDSFVKVAPRLRALRAAAEVVPPSSAT